MKKRRKHTVLFYGFLIFGFVIIVLLGTLFQKKEWKNYIRIASSSKIEGEVESIWNNRGTFMVLKNGQKYDLPFSENNAYDPSFIGSFIKKGDFVFKNSYSDSLYIYRGKVKYYFIIK